jgi:hypothetical protein
LCGSESDTRCRPCPRRGSCINNTLYCENHTVKKDGFCVIPGSYEDEALGILPQIREVKVSERNAENLSKKLHLPVYLIEAAIEFANNEDLGGFKVWYSFVLGGISFVMGLITFYMTWLRNRAQSENQYAETILKYILETPPTRMTMDTLCKCTQISMDYDAKKRILFVLSEVQEFEVSMDEMTVLRKT